MLRYEQRCVIAHFFRTYIRRSRRICASENMLDGFTWIYVPIEDGEWHLVGPKNIHAATVYLRRGSHDFIWSVWDEHGIGGENSICHTIKSAMRDAEDATIRWDAFGLLL